VKCKEIRSRVAVARGVEKQWPRVEAELEMAESRTKEMILKAEERQSQQDYQGQASQMMKERVTINNMMRMRALLIPIICKESYLRMSMRVQLTTISIETT
jgi:hypothetical protein